MVTLIDKPEEQRAEFRFLIFKRCSQDRWGADARTCWMQVAKLEVGRRCMSLLTDWQLRSAHLSNIDP